MAGNVLKDRVTGEDPVIAILEPQIPVPLREDHKIGTAFDGGQYDEDRQQKGRLGMAGKPVPGEEVRRLGVCHTDRWEKVGV
jgi:hypothetical protein